MNSVMFNLEQVFNYSLSNWGLLWTLQLCGTVKLSATSCFLQVIDKDLKFLMQFNWRWNYLILIYIIFLKKFQVGSKDGQKYKDVKNWSGAIGYGVGSGSPLSPSFNFGLELSRSNQVCFYLVLSIQTDSGPIYLHILACIQL